MLLPVKNKNGELETRDMLDIDFNMKVYVSINLLCIRILFRHEKQHRIKCSRLQIRETSWSKRLWDGKSYEIRQQPLQRYTLQRLLCI